MQRHVIPARNKPCVEGHESGAVCVDSSWRRQIPPRPRLCSMSWHRAQEAGCLQSQAMHVFCTNPGAQFHLNEECYTLQNARVTFKAQNSVHCSHSAKLEPRRRVYRHPHISQSQWTFACWTILTLCQFVGACALNWTSPALTGRHVFRLPRDLFEIGALRHMPFEQRVRCLDRRV